jgi:shikimate kinase
VVDRILLVGMMGAGKTTIGRMVADRLGWSYLDSDAQVAAETGRTIEEIFDQDGEAAFRAEESRVLAEAVAGDDPTVVSVAGGVVLSEANRDLLRRSGVVVWLRADLAVLTSRVGNGSGRPLIADDPAAVLTELYEVRRPLYASVAQVVIDVDRLTPMQVVDRVLSEVGMASTSDDRGLG